MPGTAAGTQAFKSRDGFLRDLFDGSLFRTFLARYRHVGLQDHAFQGDALNPQFLKRLVEDALGHLKQRSIS